MTTSSSLSTSKFSSKFKFIFIFQIRCDAYEFSKLKDQLGLKIDFYGFLTMIIKLLNGVIEDPNVCKIFMIMNTDSTASVNFMKLLEFKQPDQLKELNMKLKNKEVSQEYFDMQITKI